MNLIAPYTLRRVYSSSLYEKGPGARKFLSKDLTPLDSESSYGLSTEPNFIPPGLQATAVKETVLAYARSALSH